MLSLTVIMPALNEEANIAGAIDDVLSSFKKLSLETELIVVNDGSRDKTAEIVEKYTAVKDSVVRMISHDKPQGIGASFWDGVRCASKEVLVMIPGDGENDSGEVFRYLPLMNDVDIVNPYVLNKEVRTKKRNFLSFLFLNIINMTFATQLNYANGTVIYRKKILEEIRPKETGFFYQVEALIKTIKKGYIFAQVPYRLSVRRQGISKAVSFKALSGVIAGYFRLLIQIYFSAEYRCKGTFVEGSKTKERK
ncbi:MAG: glycosyltransferase family 2 protein [Candidatus Omnitrophica bacterium]|nr:glycosyltransferase family 2 protein [Candidatus Omnitrophota bacterium]